MKNYKYALLGIIAVLAAYLLYGLVPFLIIILLGSIGISCVFHAIENELKEDV